MTYTSFDPIRSTVYGLLDRADGRPVRAILRGKDVERLVVPADDSAPILSFTDLEKFVEFLDEQDGEALGPYVIDELVPVSIETVVTSTALDLKRADVPSIDVIQKRDVPRMVVKQYDRELAAMLPEGQYCFVLATIPDGQSPEDIVGRPAYLGKWKTDKRTVTAVLPVPDEYADMIPDGSDGALLICLPDARITPIRPYVTLEPTGSPAPR